LPEEDFYPDIDSLERKRDVEGLIKALENKDDLIRKEAARSLKRVGDERAVRPLIRTLKYEEWQSDYTLLSTLREYSAEALGSIGDKRAVQPLIQSVEEDADDEVRWRSIYSLGKIGDHRAVDVLIKSLKSDSWIIRENAAKALGSMGSENVVTNLIDAADDKEWRVRKNIVTSLGQIGDPEAIKPLLKLLNDEDADVRRKTIDVLSHMGSAAYKPLMELFEGKDWYTRSKAAEVLGKIGDPRSVEIFIDTLTSNKKENRNRYVRGRVAEALGNLGDVKAVDALIEALDDNTIFVRQKAEEALIKIRSQEYPGEFTQFSNGSISFNYPVGWSVKTIVFNEKFEATNPDHSIKLSIYRKSDLEDVSFEDLINIWDEIFEYQHIATTTQSTSQMGNTRAFLMIGDNLKTNNIIMIVGFMLYDFFYYLHFTVKSDVSSPDQDDINLIVNTFRIHVSYI
jgi:HEAT repeat protein